MFVWYVLVQFFRIRQNKHKFYKQNNFQSCMVHNFSSYSLSQAEINALSFGLDQHTPTNISRYSIETEFELMKGRYEECFVKSCQI